jgi:hypothetical protein
MAHFIEARHSGAEPPVRLEVAGPMTGFAAPRKYALRRIN